MKYLKLLLVLLYAVVFQEVNGADDTFTTRSGLKYQLLDFSTATNTAYRADLIGYVTSPVDLVVPDYVYVKSNHYFVRGVDPNVFKDCLALKTMEVNCKNCRIYKSSFQGCINLENAVLGNNVGSYAFEGCTSLQSIKLYGSYPEYKLESHAFEGCSKLTEFPLFSSQKINLGDYVFCGCSNLQTCSASDSVNCTSLGSYAFYGCTSLAKFLLSSSSSCTSIGAHAFDGCTSLTDFSISAKVKSIGNYAFAGCAKLTGLIIPSTITTIGAGAFKDCSMLSQIDLPSKITAISDSTFSGCAGLRKMNILSSVTTIGNCAFEGCDNLASVTSNATTPPTLGENAFPQNVVDTLYVPFDSFEAYCAAPGWNFAKNMFAEKGDIVKLVTNGINYVLDKQTKKAIIAAYGYTGNIEIPEMLKYNNTYFTVDSIEAECFKGATLESVNIPYTMTAIGGDAFKDCKLDTYIYNGDLDSWCNITFANGESNPASVVGKLIFNGEEITDIEFSENITHVPDYAFYNITRAKTVTLGEKITKLGTKSFYGCDNLTSFTCSNITPPAVGTNALPTKIAKLVVPCDYYGSYYSNSNWNFATNILSTKDDGATAEFVTAKLRYLLSKTTKTVAVVANTYNGDVTISESIDYNKATYPVTAIAADAFKGRKDVRQLTIPASVTTIGTDAFVGATNLTYNYTGTIADWCAMTFDNLNANPAYVTGKLIINGEELKEATLPETLTTVKSNVFAGCKNLTTLTSLNTTPPTVDGDFSNTSITTLYVPITAIDLYRTTKPWSDIANIMPITAEVKNIASLKDGSVVQIYPYGHAGEATLALSATTATKQLTSTEKASEDGNGWTLESDGNGAYYVKNGLGLYWAYQQSNAVYKPMTLVTDKTKAVAVTPVWNDTYSGIAFKNGKDNTYLCNIYTYNYRYNWYKADTPLTTDSNYTYVVYLTAQAGATTGIGEVVADHETGGVWYTIYGVRIDKPSLPGVYVHNGKKVIVK